MELLMDHAVAWSPRLMKICAVLKFEVFTKPGPKGLIFSNICPGGHFMGQGHIWRGYVKVKLLVL